jgi:hypothetical protein
MAGISIEEDCLLPRRTVFVEYSGPDPFAFAREFAKILRPVFEIGTSHCGEPRFMWDWSGDPIQLYLHWIADKKVSRFSTLWFSIRTVGFKAKSRNEGNFRMEVESVLRHKFDSTNWFLKGLWWIYWYIGYARMRDSMIDMCRDFTFRFINTIKGMYKLGTLQEEKYAEK